MERVSWSPNIFFSRTLDEDFRYWTNNRINSESDILIIARSKSSKISIGVVGFLIIKTYLSYIDFGTHTDSSVLKYV